jgi:hypothetical protein
MTAAADAATLEIVRGIVAEMRSQAERPKGGQTVGPRRASVPLSVVLELERALGPGTGEYSAETYFAAIERASAAEAERNVLQAWVEKIATRPCECTDRYTCWRCDAQTQLSRAENARAALKLEGK